MESKKMIGTIEKKLDVKVEKVLGVTQEGKERKCRWMLAPVPGIA